MLKRGQRCWKKERGSWINRDAQFFYFTKDKEYKSFGRYFSWFYIYWVCIISMMLTFVREIWKAARANIWYSSRKTLKQATVTLSDKMLHKCDCTVYMFTVFLQAFYIGKYFLKWIWWCLGEYFKSWCLWCYSECICAQGKLENYAWPRSIPSVARHSFSSLPGVDIHSE